MAAPRPMRPMADVISTRARSISFRTSVLTWRPRSPSSVPMPRASPWSVISVTFAGRSRVVSAADRSTTRAGPIAGLQSRLLAIALCGCRAARGLDEARCGKAEQEGAADEEQRLLAREVLDVADELANIGLPQVVGERLSLVG